MAKKKQAAATRKPTVRANSKPVLELRCGELEQEIARLITERAKVGQKLAKIDSREPEFNAPASVRITDRVESWVTLNKGPLDEETFRGIGRELFSGIRRLSKKCRVAYLGPEYSYCYLAATSHFGPNTDLVPVSTIAAVFEEVNRNQADYGVVPLENSTDGRISDSLTMFVRLPSKICGEVPLKIHHYLLAKCRRSEIQEVYSKPQALSQCRDWLAKHLPGVRLVEMTSTAAAAKLAAEKQGAAAVASRQAGVQHGLDVIEADIEDNRNNITRFAIIGREPASRTGKDKTSLMFEISHTPGALADAMNVFKVNKLNLTWIESFPLIGSKSEYLFFVELEGHSDDAKVKRAITALRKLTVRFEILGSYPRSLPVE